VHRVVPLVLGLAACSFQLTAAPPGDGGPDAMIDAVDAYVIDVPMALCLTWDPRHFDACMIPAPGTGLDLSEPGTYVLNTTTATLQSPLNAVTSLAAFSATIAQGAGEPTAFLISVEALNVRASATLRVVGDKPLIVAAWGEINVAGTIDAGSKLTTLDPGSGLALVTTTSVGAGADPTSCNANRATAGGDGNSGSGGGGGGGFRGAGGAGGRGDTGGPIAAGMAGTALAAAPSIVRGGCGGAISGRAGSGAIAPSTAQTQSPAGPGGGAIQLSARGTITITGAIVAGGAGGGPAQRGSACGGGGAGSGGFIGLDAPTMTITNATLAANGGGGGSSSRFTIAERGHEGQNGLPSATPALGGAVDNSCALQAPSGSAGSTLAGGGVPSTTTCDCGGAGGGGGAGFILTWGAVSSPGSTISPAAQAGPP